MVRLKNWLNRFMYKDSAKVYRMTPSKNGWGTGELEMVYDEIKCHLAQYGKELSAHRDDIAQKITEDLRLNYDPQFEILENDIVEVNHRGQIFRLIAGTAFKYFTHTELSVRRRKEANQK